MKKEEKKVEKKPEPLKPASKKEEVKRPVSKEAPKRSETSKPRSDTKKNEVSKGRVVAVATPVAAKAVEKSR